MKKKNKVQEIIDGFSENRFDPDGSYTGNPTNGEKPVQDADDL